MKLSIKRRIVVTAVMLGLAGFGVMAITGGGAHFNGQLVRSGHWNRF